MLTPLENFDGVKAIKIGYVRLDNEFHEVEKLEPGYI